MIAAQRLKREIGIDHLVVGVAVHQLAGWLYITSRSMAVTDLRLLNHWRRSLVSAWSPRSCRAR
jgi:hypothetical protein